MNDICSLEMQRGSKLLSKFLLENMKKYIVLSFILDILAFIAKLGNVKNIIVQQY